MEKLKTDTKFKTAYIPYSTTGYFNQLILDFLNEDEKISPLINAYTSLENIEELIKSKQFETNREILVDVIQEQYQKRHVSSYLEKQISSLKEKTTFTITAAHQPCLFGGPLYFIHKILSTIKACNVLNAKYPHYHFVPIFWQGSEDHDFEELSKINFGSEKIVWKQKEQGAVGRMSTNSLKDALHEVVSKFGEGDYGLDLADLFKNAYAKDKTFAEATGDLVHALLGEYGLIVLDPDRRELKQLFSSVMQSETTPNQTIDLIQPALNHLEEHYHVQAFPRDVNLFYLRNQIRERIEYVAEDDIYHVVNTSYLFTKSALQKEIAEFPERFSPNVITRPLYQEMILPNLMFVGGGGELAYWMQLKPLFDFYKIDYPLLSLRDSALWIDEYAQKKREKSKLSIEDLFTDTDLLLNKKLVHEEYGKISFEDEKEDLIKLFNGLKDKTTSFDQTLEKSTLAELAKGLKSIQKLEKKVIRAVKRRKDEEKNRILTVKNLLFPSGSLQERHDNFILLYLQYGPQLFDILLDNFNLFEKKFTVIIDEPTENRI